MTSLIRITATWAEMIKFTHSVFALPFAIIATFLAGRHLPGRAPAWGQLGLIVVCMIAARSVAMTFNRIADAEIDARNPRTAGRPIPTGRIRKRQAWAFLGLFAALFLAGCLGFWWFFDNPWPFGLAIPVLAYLCGYSYAKRFTRWSHFYLGSAIAISPAAAWLAIHPQSLGREAILLVAAVTCWIGGLDIIYACQDVDVDRREGLHSLPATIGIAAALWTARSAHATTVMLLAALGLAADLGWLYWCGVGAAGMLLLVENALVHPQDLSKVNLAFFTINGVVSLVMGCAAVADILLSR